MRVIVEVIGFRTGPIAAEQLARVAEAAGAWGMFFESDDVGPETFTTHAAISSTTHLRVGAWLRGDNAFVAAEQLTVLDAVSGGRAFGLSRDEDYARRVEEILSGVDVPVADDGLGRRTTSVRLSPPPRQVLLPVLVVAEGCVGHRLLADAVRLPLPAEELLVPGMPLADLVREARLAGWVGPEADAVRALG